MQPILFSAFGYPVQAYGFFIAVGYLAGLFLVRGLARRRGLPEAPYTDLCFMGLLAGLVGARALFVLTNWNFFEEHPSAAFDFWNGGLVFYGGFLLAAPLVLLYLKKRALPVALSLDILAAGLALGHAFGRVGCFFAGCCHGVVCPWPWGVRFDSDQVEASLRGLPLHPTQLYESAGLFALAAILIFMVLKNKRPGDAALTYLLGYACLRAFVEFFRGDSIRGTLPGTPLATSQAIALALLLAGGLFLLRRFRRH